MTKHNKLEIKINENETEGMVEYLQASMTEIIQVSKKRKACLALIAVCRQINTKKSGNLQGPCSQWLASHTSFMFKLSQGIP